jgi:hypothetical protein
LSGAIQAASLNGEALGWQRLTSGVYRLRTVFESTAEIRVR